MTGTGTQADPYIVSTLADLRTAAGTARSEEHTSELQSLSAISYDVSLIGRAHV